MKSTTLAILAILLHLVPVCTGDEIAPSDAPGGTEGVKVDIAPPFTIFLTAEIQLTHHTGRSSSVSHWTKQVKSSGNFERKHGDRFEARVLNNGFLEIINADEVLLIPLEKVAAIRVRREAAKSAEQGAATNPRPPVELKSEGS